MIAQMLAINKIETAVINKNEARKRSTNSNVWVQISSGGVGVFHAKGCRAKISVCPSKPGQTNFLSGFPGILAAISRGRLHSLRKKVSVQCLASKERTKPTSG